LNLKNTILDDAMKNYLIITLTFFSSVSQAQVVDNFSDGNFTTDPVWSGSTDQFIVNASYQLQLNNTVAGTSWLSTPFQVNSLDSMVWRTIVRQSFSPSGSNYGRVYLSSDRADLSAALHGYYLQFGESGSNDAIELFRQSGTVSTSICRGRNGAIASSFLLNVQVIRLPAGQWQIAVDYTGGNSFTPEASGTDSAYQTSSFCGFLCVYTSSNAAKFYYDDFYAGLLHSDTEAPTVVSIKSISSRQLSVTFSEAVESASANEISHYAGDNNIGNPQTAALQSDQKTVLLTFQKDFENGIQNHLTISGVEDLSHNTIVTAQFPFVFFQASPVVRGDIIFTEIFPDPSPAIGLPADEYVELYNRSKNPIDLAAWRLSDGSSVGLFPTQLLLPGQYRIITSSSVASAFVSFPNVTGLDGFPSLNNDGDVLVLKNKDGLTIDSVNYSLSWYHDADKQNGGWSMERIDLSTSCSSDDNWAASEDPRGGTPGIQNSVNASKPDVTGPQLQHVVPVQTNQLLVSFNEALDASTPFTGQIEITPEVLVSRISFVDVSLRSLQIDLASTLDSGKLYTLTAANITDCSGNPLQTEFSQLTFSIPEPGDSLDILINEILFNPRPSGVDFVEVYNNSAKYIDLRQWKLANFENGILKNISTVTSEDFTLAPHSYLAFTTDSTLLKNNYSHGQEQNFFVTDLPSLPDDSGSIALVNDRGDIIDYFSYDAGFHSRLLKDVEGVSLERISFSDPTNDPQNWNSASSQCGFATPGYLNSSSRKDPPVSKGNVVVDPVIISPGSGYQDFAKINYQFEVAGYVANLKILDQQGRVIRTISNNETLGVEGFFRWNGDRDDGSKARMGYYVAWFEVFNIEGTVKTFRKRIVVAGR
jgi:hypothetical protein